MLIDVDVFKTFNLFNYHKRHDIEIIIDSQQAHTQKKHPNKTMDKYINIESSNHQAFNPFYKCRFFSYNRKKSEC